MKKYSVVMTKTYRRDYKRLTKANYDMHKLHSVIDRLASGEILPDQFSDHAVRGIFAGASSYFFSSW